MKNPWSVEQVSDHWARTAALVPGIFADVNGPARCATAGIAPIMAERGEGAWFWDVQGRKFCDATMCWGANILGYRHPRVEQAIAKQLERGTFFPVPTPLVGEVAERLVALIPCAEQVAFAKNGSDATLLAVRIARAATGREHVLVAHGHFHGFNDWFAPRLGAAGIPSHCGELIHEVDLLNPDTLSRYLKSHARHTAAIILEPARDFEPDPAILRRMIEIAHKNGVLVIFDEMITGLRLAPGGAQQYYDALPDLACFGKSLANGLPLSCVAGPRDLMGHAPRAFVSMTYQYEQLAFAAAGAVLREIADGKVSDHLWRAGRRLQSFVTREASRHNLPLSLRGPGPRLTITYTPPHPALIKTAITYLIEGLWRREVHTNGNILLSSAHGESELSHMETALAGAIADMADALAQNDLTERLVVPFPII